MNEKSPKSDYQPSQRPYLRNSTRVHLLPASFASSLSLSISRPLPLSRTGDGIPDIELRLEGLVGELGPRGNNAGIEREDPETEGGEADRLGTTEEDDGKDEGRYVVDEV